MFTAVSFGLSKTEFGQMISSAFLKVRKEGQGESGKKRPVLFPKLTFLYDKNLHGEGKELEWLFDEAIDCSSRAQYPDFLSLTADYGYTSTIYKERGVPISRMGCVSGKHQITFRKKDTENSLTLSLESFWELLTETNKVENLYPVNPASSDFITLSDIEVLDIDRFVNCRRIIRNPDIHDWYKVTLENNLEIFCTSDHYWSVDNLYAVQTVDLVQNDLIPIVKDGAVVLIRIKDIKFLGEYEEYSYDLSTETEHFNCDTLRSHNCRAALSPWYEKGGMNPIDSEEGKDTFIAVGRCNLGAISLNIPMIVAKAKEENKDFFEVLEYYLQIIRGIHKKTFEFLSHKKAGTNPLAFCQGGLYHGNKHPNEELGKDFLKPMTLSFGFTALNEATILYNGKTIREDNSEFAYSILKYINDFIIKYKKIDDLVYALYATPAESLCALQVKQFKKKYGVVKRVSDKAYMTNSFHMHVSEDITPIEKIDLEDKCYHQSNGGNICYTRYPIDYNLEAIKTIVRYGMEHDMYLGVNMDKSYCSKGHEFLDSKDGICPICGDDDVVTINRICGYLGYSRIHGKSMMNEGKLEEIKDRKSM